MASAQGLILADGRQVGGSFGELFEPSENTSHHLSDLLERATIVDVEVVKRRELGRREGRQRGEAVDDPLRLGDGWRRSHGVGAGSDLGGTRRGLSASSQNLSVSRAPKSAAGS